jgi:hypothetical protein
MAISEQPPWNRDHGKLERGVPTAPDHLGAEILTSFSRSVVSDQGMTF